MMHDAEQEQLREQSIGELIKRLSQETTLLVRQEIELAKTELAEKGKAAGAGAGMFGAAGVLGLGAFGALTAFLILALSLVMSPWLAALIVAVVYGIAAAIAGIAGKKKFEDVTPPIPQTVQTIKDDVQTIKEDVQWAKTRTKSDTR